MLATLIVEEFRFDEPISLGDLEILVLVISVVVFSVGESFVFFDRLGHIGLQSSTCFSTLLSSVQIARDVTLTLTL